MSDTTIIVEKYSRAAFNIAKKSDVCDKFAENLQIFCDNTKPFLKELSNPSIAKSDLKDIVKDICEKLKIDSNVKDFLLNLASARRLNIVNKVQTALKKLVKQHNNIIEVDLVSAHALQKEQIEETKKLIEQKYPQKTVEINEIVDNKILGGVVVKIGSFVIDNSIKNQLSSIYAECKSAI